MKLRKFNIKDAPYMYEWMQDEDVVKYMLADFSNMAFEDCVRFIKEANQDKFNLHYAVCNDGDEYLGTISLKNINERHKNAEYAIIFRKKAMGSGAAMWATNEILKIAFLQLGLNRVYLDVLCNNKRAIRFYQKVGFTQEGIWEEHFFLNGKFCDVMWLSYLKEDWVKISGQPIITE